MTLRDNLALCAMQVLLKEECKIHITLWNRIKRMFGFSYYSFVSIDPTRIASRAYAIADRMVDISENSSNNG